MEAAQIQDRVPADVRDFLKMLAETDFEHELLMRVWRLGYDDALDAFGVHGVGGALGAVLTGVFATRAVWPGSTTAQGLIEGNPGQVVNQVVGIGASAVVAIVGTLVLLKVLDAVMGLRVTQNDELMGLDVSQHGEEGYIFM